MTFTVGNYEKKDGSYFVYSINEKINMKFYIYFK